MSERERESESREREDKHYSPNRSSPGVKVGLDRAGQGLTVG